jgi:hypothetical protein
MKFYDKNKSKNLEEFVEKLMLEAIPEDKNKSRQNSRKPIIK